MARRIDGERLGQRMKAFRDEKGLSQVAAAKQLGFDLRQWTRWENGEHLPQTSNLERLIDAIGLDESELFGNWTEPAVRVARLEERLAAVERRVAGLERITADDDEGTVDDENTVTTWTVEAELELPGSADLEELEQLLEDNGADRLELLASKGGTSSWRFEVFTDFSSAALRLAADYIADSCASTGTGEQPTRADIRTIRKNARVLRMED